MSEKRPLYGRRNPELATIPQGEVMELAMNTQARTIVLLVKAIISAVGKEEAGKIIRKTRYEYYYSIGRALAEKLGNPKDIDSYLNEWFLKTPSSMSPWKAPGTVVYRTPKKVVYRSSDHCFLGNEFKKVADEDLLKFLAENFCIEDLAWANGFNPDMKYEVTKHLLRGDQCCEFTFEV